MSFVIETVNLSKQYLLGHITVNALQSVNLKFSKGEFVVILGTSGSGKTTLLNILGTLDNVTSGKAFIDGKDLTCQKERELVALRRKKIGFVFQFFNLVPVLTAFENIELPMVISDVPKQETKKRAEKLLKDVGLQDRANHRPDELSGGQQQRVAIARALANQPAIVLADEPTGDLDTTTGQQVMQLLLDLSKAQGTTVVVATHDQSMIGLADRVVRMQDGRVISDHQRAGKH
jgi:putative ABC transport system ATP-binding protein